MNVGVFLACPCLTCVQYKKGILLIEYIYFYTPTSMVVKISI